jgi:subtilase family serine protease
MKKRYIRFAVGAATVSLLVATGIQSVSMAGGTSNWHANWSQESKWSGNGPWQIDNNTTTVARACNLPSAGNVACDAYVMSSDKTAGQSPWANYAGGKVTAKDTLAQNPYGLSPQQLISAYNFPTTNANGSLPGTGETIAVVDAMDDPNIASDLATFDTQFGLPQLNSCTISATSGPCFQKVSETGTSVYPAFDQSWAAEISLDVEYAHAIAPGASILLVEASSTSLVDFAKAVTYAGSKAQYVSMSWGTAESTTDKTYDTLLNAKVSYFAASGDGGVGTSWPSTSPKVISVGGTSLLLNADGTVASETGWVNGGGGCSTLEAASASQLAYSGYAQVGCNGKKATPDVSADGDPNTGVLVYDSNNYFGYSGWFTVGGTSLATPIWAARAADTGALVNPAYIYGSNTIKWNDITSGGNADGCTVGYDMCSGIGSWNN